MASDSLSTIIHFHEAVMRNIWCFVSDLINWRPTEIGPDLRVLSDLGSLHGLEQPRFKSNFSQGWYDGHFVLQAQPRKVRLCKVSIMASEAATDSLYDLRWPQDHNNFSWGWYGEHFSYKTQPPFVRPHEDGGLICDLYSWLFLHLLKSDVILEEKYWKLHYSGVFNIFFYQYHTIVKILKKYWKIFYGCSVNSQCNNVFCMQYGSGDARWCCYLWE